GFGGALCLTSVRYDSLTARIYGDVAVLRGILDNAGTFRGFPFSGKIRYTPIFVRRAARRPGSALEARSSRVAERKEKGDAFEPRTTAQEGHMGHSVAR